MACLSKHAAGPKWEQQQRLFEAQFWQQKSNPNHVPGLEWQKAYRSRQKHWFVDPVPDSEAKTILYPHPRTANIWENFNQHPTTTPISF